VRGNKRVYPWGDSFDKAKCNTSESGIGTTTPVGAYSSKRLLNLSNLECEAEAGRGAVTELDGTVAGRYAPRPADRWRP